MKSRWIFKANFLLFIPLMVALLILVACGDDATPTPTATSPPVVPTATSPPAAPTATTRAAAMAATSTPAPTAAPVAGRVVPAWVKDGISGGVMNFAHKFDAGFWDIHYGGSEATTLMPSQGRYNQLIEFDPANVSEIIGDLADSWSLADDGTTYTFNLADAKWHDGKPVLASDVVWTLDRIVQPGEVRGRSAALRLFYEQGTAKAIDNRTVVMPTNFQAAAFIPSLASDFMKMYPEHIASKLSQEDLNCCPEKMLGSGPWVFTEWKRKVSYAYDKNPNYFKEGLPFFDGITVFIIADINRLISSLKVGQTVATYAPATGSFLPDDMKQLEIDTDGKMRQLLVRNSHGAAMTFNLDIPPFDDPKVRRAFYLALDRQEIIDTIYSGWGVPGTFFAPGDGETVEKLLQRPGYRSGPSGGKHPDDIAEAKRLMAEAGYPDGKNWPENVVYNAPTSTSSIAHAELIKEQMKRVLGVELDVRVFEIATHYLHLKDKKFAITNIGGGRNIPDPTDVIGNWFTSGALRNPHNWNETNARFNELAVTQAKELDSVKRKSLLAEMSDILHEGESHMLVMLWRHVSGTMDYRLQNFITPLTTQTIKKWEHVWWDPDAPLPPKPN